MGWFSGDGQCAKVGVGLLDVALGRHYFVRMEVGVLLLGAIGHWLERVSMRSNEVYQALVQPLAPYCET